MGILNNSLPRSESNKSYISTRQLAFPWCYVINLSVCFNIFSSCYSAVVPDYTWASYKHAKVGQPTLTLIYGFIITYGQYLCFKLFGFSDRFRILSGFFLFFFFFHFLDKMPSTALHRRHRQFSASAHAYVFTGISLCVR